MKRIPRLAFPVAILLAGAFVLVFLQRHTSRDVLRISIVRNPTHIAIGQTSLLQAYEEYQYASIDAAKAASANGESSRELITPKWSVSDPQTASISEDGTIKALKPGRVLVEGHWEGFETSTTIDVVKDLPMGVLPQVAAKGSRCQPQQVDLNLNTERALSFEVKFAGDDCSNLTIQTTAPDKPLPWAFDNAGAHLELKSAHGAITSGQVSLPSGGDISFTVWSEGNGAYPISLAGKTVLLTGDSMSEGIGWTMRAKVETAGGRLVVQPWYSSTTVGWQAEGRMKQYIEEYKPDIVFVALGSNEIFTGDMPARAQAVKDITAEIGDRPAYWIGPPSWKPDHGIVHTIEENFPSGHFYNSNDLRVPRRKDGAHPTNEGYATWTELIWNWYARNSQ
jgi:lysophospholipase L1-like esterase